MQLLWNGREAFQAALETVAAAEHAARQDEAQLGREPQQFVWRQDMLRPATDAKQVLATAHDIPFSLYRAESRRVLHCCVFQVHTYVKGLQSIANISFLEMAVLSSLHFCW